MAQLPLVIEIPKRGATCAKGGEPLVAGEEYYSVLLEDPEKPGYLRQDFCLKCWQELQPKAFKSYWKARVPKQWKPPKKEESPFDRAFRILREDLQNPTPENLNEAFILSIFLSRKRRLLLRQEIVHEGEAAYLYEDPATEEILCIKKVEVSALKREEIQQALAKKFKG
jgi:hypothetical protein